MKLDETSQKMNLQIILRHAVFTPKIPELVSLINEFSEYFNQIPDIKPPSPTDQNRLLVALTSKKEEKKDKKTEFILFFYDKIIINTRLEEWKLDFVQKIISKIQEINGADFKINNISIGVQDLFNNGENPLNEFYKQIGLKQNICKESDLRDVSFAIRYVYPYEQQNILLNFEALTTTNGIDKSINDEPDSILIRQTAQWRCTSQDKVNEFISFIFKIREEKINNFKK